MGQRKYQQMSYEERVSLALLLEAGLSLREIAEELDRSPSTISREVRRNFPTAKTGDHLARNAHKQAFARRVSSRTYPRLRKPGVREYVCAKLKIGWSPELIAGRITRDIPGITVSHEAIYQFIYTKRRDLIPCLHQRHRRRARVTGNKWGKPPPIPQRTMINERPEEANQRKQLGHWEVDTVLPSKDGKASLVVAVDRRSRLTRIRKITSKCSSEVERQLISMLCRYPKRKRKTITYDNGAENSRHLVINTTLGTKSYFCNSYCSWEKGSVENTISLIRRFIPRNTSMNHLDTKFINKIERWINNRPKKILNFRSPYEIFNAVALSP